MRIPAPVLSIVIPAYNEAGRLSRTLPPALEYLTSRAEPFEVLVCDDGSRDGTAEVALADRVRLLRTEANFGKGAAVRRGMLAARGEFVLFSDADFSTPMEDCERLVHWLRKGWDVAIGSRALAHSRIEVHQPWTRERMGKVFNLLVQALVLPGLHDTQCGFKAFRAAAAREVFSRTRLDGFAFDVEALYLARRMGLRTREVPVTWRNSEETKVDAVRDAARMFRDLFVVRRMHG